MGTASLTFDSCTLAWRRISARLLPNCGRPDCLHSGSLWRRLRCPQGILLQGARYCLDRCLELALADALGRMHSPPRRAAGHRIPLGLLLLSRQQLSADELRQALAAQRAAGHGRIGEWLQQMGFVNDAQITGALARQWACPVLPARALALERRSGHIPQLPLALLESFEMVPVDYVPATATLHVAFGERIDYTVLYAIEQMLGVHTEPCLVLPSALRLRLAALTPHRPQSEQVFDRVADSAEQARIIRSYSVCSGATEIRMVACEPHLWVRLLRTGRNTIELLLRSPREASLIGPGSMQSRLTEPVLAQSVPTQSELAQSPSGLSLS